MADQSPSAYDLSLATIALGAGWSDQEVVNLLICWRRKHGHDLKLRENYYGLTLNTAKEPIEIAQAEEQLNEALLLCPEDLPEVLKANLKTLFRVDIIRIVKYAGDPPIYYMYTKQGDITLGEINSITSQTKFRNMLAKITGVWITAVSLKAWDKRVQALLLACEEIDVGDASHPTQETNAWLEEYLLEKPPREEDEWLKAAEAKQPSGSHPQRKGPHLHGRLPEVAGSQHRRAGYLPRPGAATQAVPGPDGEGQREGGKLPDLQNHLATARENPCRTGPGRTGPGRTSPGRARVLRVSS